MPIYEYRCTKGHSFEVMQSVNDEPLKKCQVCGSPVRRVLHPPAVHFKGSGFYNTDYGTRKRSRELKESGEGKGKQSKDESSSKSSSDSSSSTSTSKKAETAGAGSSSKSD